MILAFKFPKHPNVWVHAAARQGGQRLNFVGNRYAWVHQALVAVDYSVITDQDNGYFLRRKASHCFSF